MGVKFAKEYALIMDDLTRALQDVEDVQEALGMEPEDWGGLNDDEKAECLRTLADDVFYALGADPVMEIGLATVTYDKGNHVIRLAHPDKVVRIVHLL
ncbi:hypothetical protein [Gorillibacterium massiliense]|uniref:hypothetical protein n=1 Tax=Gorillibacterium massiliense TaxID=1280390 RepID=UPI000593F698|nr:hypothetical protein [Gorillibacterium massiliense]